MKIYTNKDKCPVSGENITGLKCLDCQFMYDLDFPAGIFIDVVCDYDVLSAIPEKKE